MSGTSVDGIDAVLVRISGHSTSTAVEEVAFRNFPYPHGIKDRIFRLFEPETSSSADICHMNFVLGNLFAGAALQIAEAAGINIKNVDIIGSHGQTIYHIPEPVDNDYPIISTLQIGEGAVIAHKTGVLTVSDFRVADVAAGGLGAPLVPYTEYILYRNETETTALQNIGGIGNITVIPVNSTINDVTAFDTGPGNMVIDYVMNKTTGMEYDNNGDFAATGKVCEKTLSILMKDDFFAKPPPKATGREYFGKAFCEKFLCMMKDYPNEDIVATATAFTAESIKYAIEKHVHHAVNKLIVGGGGAFNKTLMKEIRQRLPYCVVLTHEQTGRCSDAKEAVAFAILANEAVCGNPGNLPRVTGADSFKVLGKINL